MGDLDTGASRRHPKGGGNGQLNAVGRSEASAPRTRKPKNLNPNLPLTRKEKAFVRNYVKSQKVGEAALRSGFSSRHYGSWLLRQQKIVNAVERLMDRLGMTDEYLLTKLKEGLEAKYPAQYYKDGALKQEGAADYHTRDKYLDKAFKLKGHYAPEKTEEVRQINLVINLNAAQGLLDSGVITVEEFDEIGAAETPKALPEASDLA